MMKMDILTEELAVQIKKIQVPGPIFKELKATEFAAGFLHSQGFQMELMLQ